MISFASNFVRAFRSRSLSLPLSLILYSYRRIYIVLIWGIWVLLLVFLNYNCCRV